MSYRYLGNKTRLADWIVGIVNETLPPNSLIADVMCGTASMSVAFAKSGHRVIAADELTFPVLHARARLSGEPAQSFEGFGLSYYDALEELNSLEPIRGFFWQEYSEAGRPRNGSNPRRYFTSENAGRIDAIRSKIRYWGLKGLNRLGTGLLLHDLILATNRVANIAGTYGYYRSDFSSASRVALRLTPTEPDVQRGAHRVLQGSASHIVEIIKPDAVYLDPPYTKRQYSGNYHIPETLAREDEPEPAGAGGLRDWSRQASDFCYRRRAADAFKAVLDKCTAPWLFISYSEDAHLTEAELTKLLQNYGNVERHARALGRFRSNGRVARMGAVHEHLYVVEMVNAVPAQSCRGLVQPCHTAGAL
jgi:adenine-specific DNA-methyltransferase